MSIITNDGLTRSGTGCCTHMATVGVKGLTSYDNICYCTLIGLSVFCVSLQYYTTFWSLSMYDLHVPTTAYDKQIQQHKTQMALEDDKDMVTDTASLSSYLQYSALFSTQIAMWCFREDLTSTLWNYVMWLKQLPLLSPVWQWIVDVSVQVVYLSHVQIVMSVCNCNTCQLLQHYSAMFLYLMPWNLLPRTVVERICSLELCIWIGFWPLSLSSTSASNAVTAWCCSLLTMMVIIIQTYVMLCTHCQQNCWTEAVLLLNLSFRIVSTLFMICLNKERFLGSCTKRSSGELVITLLSAVIINNTVILYDETCLSGVWCSRRARRRKRKSGVRWWLRNFLTRRNDSTSTYEWCWLGWRVRRTDGSRQVSSHHNSQFRLLVLLVLITLCLILLDYKEQQLTAVSICIKRQSSKDKLLQPRLKFTWD